MNYKEAVIAFMDGKAVEYQIRTRSNWRNLGDASGNDISNLVQGLWSEPVKFRIKPRTVKLGSREVEAPVLDPVDGQAVWFSLPNGDARAYTYSPQSHVESHVRKGLAFASRPAAVAFHEASVAYILEQLQ